MAESAISIVPLAYKSIRQIVVWTMMYKEVPTVVKRHSRRVESFLRQAMELREARIKIRSLPADRQQGIAKLFNLEQSVWQCLADIDEEIMASLETECFDLDSFRKGKIKTTAEVTWMKKFLGVLEDWKLAAQEREADMDYWSWAITNYERDQRLFAMVQDVLDTIRGLRNAGTPVELPVARLPQMAGSQASQA